MSDKNITDAFNVLVKDAVETQVKEQATALVTDRIKGLSKNLSEVIVAQERKLDAKLEERLKDVVTGHRKIEVFDNGEVRVVEGHMHPVTHEVISCIKNPDIIPLLVGPAGCGKTHMVKHIAEAFGLRYGAQSMSEGITEGKLIGRETKDGYIMGIVEDYMRNGGVLLLDELDAALDNVLIILNSALANGYLINGRGEVINQHPDCLFLASANTFGNGADRLYCGRNQLDAATLDRFVSFEMDYDTKFETQCATKEICDFVWGIRKKASENKVRVVASTRMIKKGQGLLDCGFKLDRVKQLLTAGWSPDVRKQVGLN